jgi:hypothetical protein
MGTILDALITAAEGAVSGLTGERGVRATLKSHEKPRLFLYNPAETVELSDHLQETVSIAVEGALLDDVTQEVMALNLDAIRDAIRADATLGGVVRWAYVSERAIVESEDTNERIGILVFQTVQEN